jgi:hypothetical protein
MSLVVEYHFTHVQFEDGLNYENQCFFCEGHNTKRRYEIDCHYFIGEDLFEKTIYSCMDCSGYVDDTKLCPKKGECKQCI